MKKRVLLALFLIFHSITSLFAADNDKQIVYAMLMNQIQFSLQTIQHYQSRYVLNQEYENIICKIDKQKLKLDKNDDEEAIIAYSNMLTTLTYLTLQENEKLFVKQQAEKEKSEAIYKSLSGAGTSVGFAAVAFASGNYAQAVSGLVFGGVSGAFSYRDAVNTVENQENRELFKLEQKTLETINMQKNFLWTTYARYITKYNIPKQYEIKQDQMLWLVETLDTKDASSKVRLLEEKRNVFSIFTPYWYELGSAYQTIGNFAKAKECYTEFERQKSLYSIIDNDTYYTELAKNRILIAQKEKDIPTIKKYLQIIEKDETVSNESENRFYMAGVYFTLGENSKALSLLKLVIDDNRQFVSQSRKLYEYIDACNTTDDNYKKAVMFSQLKIAPEEEILNVIENSKNKTNFATGIIKHFTGTEEEKILNKSNLVFYFPSSFGQNYNLNIKFNDTYYDSLSFIYQNRIYYFINYDANSFFSKIRDFDIILDGQDGDQITLKYQTHYYNSSDIKTLNNTFTLMNDSEKGKNNTFDITYIDLIDVDDFLNSYRNLEKNKEFNKSDKDSKIKTVVEKYNAASKKNLSAPYVYQDNVLLNKSEFIYKYGLYTIEDKSKNYEVSKYGDLKAPKNIKKTLTGNLQETYRKALIGSSEDQYAIGMAYLNGEGIVIDYFEALKWFKLSAIKGNMNSYYQLGICFENGYGTEKNKDRAIYYYEQAAALGHQKAKAALK